MVAIKLMIIIKLIVIKVMLLIPVSYRGRVSVMVNKMMMIKG